MARDGQGSLHPDITLWRQYVRHWFPRLHERAYFVPPVYMNRVHYETVQLAGLNVDIPQPPVVNLPRGAKPALQLSHVRDDQAQQRILHCLHKLTETQGEPMVVISQLQFGDYLNNPCYAAAASMLPRPIDLKKENKHRGDFDLLLIHKHYGLVVGEIKTVGDNFSSLGLTEQQQDDLVAKKVQQAVKQLDRAGDVITHLVSDQQHPPGVRKTMMLPNITRFQLQRILDNYPRVRQDLCRCLGVEKHADPIDLCLYAELLPDRNTPWDVTDDVLRSLSQWWSTAVAGPHVSSTEDDYVDLVARFTGPATTVQVFCIAQPPLHFRSQGEGVAETSRRFTRDIVLTPHQLDILNRNLPLVFLCGPPGTGKTVMLVVRARDWLCRGFHVHVLSLWEHSLAASELIVHQLQQSSGHTGHPVHLHVFHFSKGRDEEETAVKCLVTAASQGPLCVVVDEAYTDRVFTNFCAELCEFIPGLRLWAASVYHGNIPPCLTEVPMTEPLRTPPVVTRHVQQSDWIQKPNNHVRDYTTGPTPPPCDGPAPRVLYHTGQGHGEGSAVDCVECGKNVASVLTELHVGMAGQDATSTTTIPAPLTYRHVFLLTTYTELDDEETDAAGNVVSPASGVVRGLRQAGVPVRVVKPGDAGAVRDLALMAGPDQVVAAGAATVSGLERPVVVWVREGVTRSGAQVADEWRGRLDAVSRTTSQLVWIVPPFLDDDR